MKKELALVDIELDPSLQMRAVDPPVEEYEEVLRKNKGEWPFPSLQVVQVDDRMLLISGWTRYRAAIAAGRKVAPVEVVKGAWADAVKMACAENAEHGFRRTSADKRRAVLRAVEEGISGPTILSKVCRLSRTTVYTILAELESARDVKSKSKSKAKAESKAAGKSQSTKRSELDEECPVCGSSDWVATDAGHECSSCKHIHGESGGVDEEVEFATPEESATNGVAADLKAVNADFGRLLRGLKRAGLDAQTSAPMRKVHAAIQAAMKR